jgi:hypothetical protein
MFKTGPDFNGITTDFAIFHIGLVRNGAIQKKGYFFPTIRTLKEMLVHS